MDKDILERKIDHLRSFLLNLKGYVSVPYLEFHDKIMAVRACEREFQLFVDTAIDVNTALLIEKGRPVPDSYYDTFIDMGNLGVIEHDLSRSIARCAKVRNVVVHEYDIDVDTEKFYNIVRELAPIFEKYLRQIFKYIDSKDTSS